MNYWTSFWVLQQIASLLLYKSNKSWVLLLWIIIIKLYLYTYRSIYNNNMNDYYYYLLNFIIIMIVNKMLNVTIA